MNAKIVEETRFLPDKDSQQIQMINSHMGRMPFDEETDDFTRLKLKINNLLWEELPSKITVGDAEKIACEIMAKIIKTKEEKEK